jgi:N-acetylglucosaminyldiphosphoundecaprenol N-acetyl-beta-D-mannosaminyltransferase
MQRILTPRAVVLGCPIDRLDLEETVARCDHLIRSRAGAQHVVINAAKLVALRRDPRLSAIIERCALVNADGQSVVWASRLLGDPLPERVAGIDVMERLLWLAQEKGYGAYILGARADVLERAVARLQEQYPRLEIVGHHHGWFAEDESRFVCEQIRSARPEILLVAMSSPRKEYWLDRYGPELGVPFMMGVGGAIDVVAGATRRAPRWMQRIGLEWLFRLLQEPRRLWRRYLVTNTRFALLVGRELIAQASGRSKASPPKGGCQGSDEAPMSRRCC